MKISTKDLLENLKDLTKDHIQIVSQLKKESDEILNWKQDSESWSILECIEHLNRYGEFYIPEISLRISQAKHSNVPIFKSNWLGTYFSNTVSYKEKLNKMKTFSVMNPNNSNLENTVLDTFVEHQHQLLNLLKNAEKVHLDRTKTAISISKLIKLKIGDTFRVVIFHNQRHLKQAERAKQLGQQNLESVS